MKSVWDESTMRTAGLLALVGLLAAPVARAEEAHEPEGRIEVGVMGGWHFFSKNVELGVLDAPGMVPVPEDSVLLGARLAYALDRRFSLEGEVVGMPTQDNFAGDPAFVLGWRAHALLHILPTGRVRPFVLAGAGALSVFADGSGDNQIQNDTDFAFHWGAGVKFDVTPRFSLRADFRHLLPPSTRSEGTTSDVELHLGVAYRFGGEPAAPAVAEQKDTDGDGLLDASDKCPAQAETVNGVDDEDGCPETDDDGDQLLGSQDKCPAAAEDRDGFQDEDGCPDPDNDSDGVPDASDKCPSETETRNGYQDDDGCPDELPQEVKQFTGVIAGIRFQKGSANVQADSFKLLDQVVTVLKENPTVRLEVSGHTSAEGDRDYNLSLSQQRAEAVKQYLVSKGIDPSRITSLGAGPDRPITSNDTQEGREKNRRIEFRIINPQE